MKRAYRLFGCWSPSRKGGSIGIVVVVGVVVPARSRCRFCEFLLERVKETHDQVGMSGGSCGIVTVRCGQSSKLTKTL